MPSAYPHKKTDHLLDGPLFFISCSHLFTPQRSFRWQACLCSIRIRDKRGGTLLVRRNCCKWSAERSPTHRAFFSWPFWSARICVLDVAYYYFFNLFISAFSALRKARHDRRKRRHKQNHKRFRQTSRAFFPASWTPAPADCPAFFP